MSDKEIESYRSFASKKAEEQFCLYRHKGSTHCSVPTVNSQLLSPPTTWKVHFIGESTFLYDLPLNEEIFGIGDLLPPLPP